MKITLLVVGKLKNNGGFSDMDAFYQKRVKMYSSLDVIELKEKPDIKSQTETIIKSIPEGSFVIALREEGKKLDSMKFSKQLQKAFEQKGHITFVIGGSYGFGDIREDLSLSIAPWTLPHQLARVNVLEQIYRGLSIHKGSNYHHG